MFSIFWKNNSCCTDWLKFLKFNLTWRMLWLESQVLLTEPNPSCPNVFWAGNRQCYCPDPVALLARSADLTTSTPSSAFRSAGQSITPSMEGRKQSLNKETKAKVPETIHQLKPFMVPGFLMATLWAHQEDSDSFSLLYSWLEIKLPSMTFDTFFSPYIKFTKKDKTHRWSPYISVTYPQLYYLVFQNDEGVGWTAELSFSKEIYQI